MQFRSAATVVALLFVAAGCGRSTSEDASQAQPAMDGTTGTPAMSPGQPKQGQPKQLPPRADSPFAPARFSTIAPDV